MNGARAVVRVYAIHPTAAIANLANETLTDSTVCVSVCVCVCVPCRAVLCPMTDASFPARVKRQQRQQRQQQRVGTIVIPVRGSKAAQNALLRLAVSSVSSGADDGVRERGGGDDDDGDGGDDDDDDTTDSSGATGHHGLLRGTTTAAATVAAAKNGARSDGGARFGRIGASASYDLEAAEERMYEEQSDLAESGAVLHCLAWWCGAAVVVCAVVLLIIALTRGF